MNTGMVIQGEISRRDIADGIRSIPDFTVPTPEDVKSYESLCVVFLITRH